MSAEPGACLNRQGSVFIPTEGLGSTCLESVDLHEAFVLCPFLWLVLSLGGAGEQFQG